MKNRQIDLVGPPVLVCPRPNPFRRGRRNCRVFALAWGHILPVRHSCLRSRSAICRFARDSWSTGATGSLSWNAISGSDFVRGRRRSPTVPPHTERIGGRSTLEYSGNVFGSSNFCSGLARRDVGPFSFGMSWPFTAGLRQRSHGPGRRPLTRSPAALFESLAADAEVRRRRVLVGAAVLFEKFSALCRGLRSRTSWRVSRYAAGYVPVDAWPSGLC